MGLDDLPTLAEQQAAWSTQAHPKGPSRLDQRTKDDQQALVDERKFRAEVIRRDGERCRCCGRKVVKVLRLQPDRLEVHHIHGRRGVLRFEPRAALVLCLVCHQKVTGAVNERIVILPTRTFGSEGQRYTDARFSVRFERVA